MAQLFKLKSSKTQTEEQYHREEVTQTEEIKVFNFSPKIERRKKILKKSRQNTKKFINHHPLDLLSEVLLNLPVKSVVRFSCVSKL